jgi:cell division transport system permease protein
MLKIWLRQHRLALHATVTGFWRTPVATALTVVVIGITVALPSGLYVAVSNAQRLAAGWEGPGQVSLYLRDSVSDKDAERLAARLAGGKEVTRTELISPEQALAELRRQEGFDDILKSLARNPLPAVVVVHPAASHQHAEALAAAAREYARLAEVERVVLDLEWVRRLHAWLDIIERALWLLAVALAAAVLLIVGNTIRLGVLNRRDEIAVIKLVGGTDAFIRRPFLYAGLLQGLLGGLVAWLLIAIALVLLAGPIRGLAELYQSDFALEGLDLDSTLLLIGSATALGWIGSRLAVIRHLRAIEPI